MKVVLPLIKALASFVRASTRYQALHCTWMDASAGKCMHIAAAFKTLQGITSAAGPPVSVQLRRFEGMPQMTMGEERKIIDGSLTPRRYRCGARAYASRMMHQGFCSHIRVTSRRTDLRRLAPQLAALSAEEGSVTPCEVAIYLLGKTWSW